MAKKPKDHTHDNLLIGNCLETLKTLADTSVDSIVTDPPYELGLMGKSWDSTGIAYRVELWQECMRVLKPGGHLLAFGGTRTYHRMAVAIEDAGFEIRDSIHWTYGSGFPKSLDLSKAIDRQRHDRSEIYKVTAWVKASRDAANVTNKEIDNAFGLNGMAGHWTSNKSQPAVPTIDQVPKLLEILGISLDDVPDDIRRLLWDLNGHAGQPGTNWLKREITGQHNQPPASAVWQANYDESIDAIPRERRDLPSSDLAKKWMGWGTALKPSHEPIVVARKPFTGTAADTVLQHGTGGVNIDASRIGNSAGRFPANTLLTHNHDCGTTCTPSCPVDLLDQQQAEVSRFFHNSQWTTADDLTPFIYQAKPGKKERNAGLDGLPEKRPDERTETGMGTFEEKGVAKQSNFHPTVKPVELIRYLIRMVTQPGGKVLDPFLGSGTTAVAAVLEGFEWVGCEITEDYLPIIKGRVAWATKEANTKKKTTHPTGEKTGGA